MKNKISYRDNTIDTIKFAQEYTVRSYVDVLEEQNQQLKREIRVLWECFKRLKEDKK